MQMNKIQEMHTTSGIASLPVVILLGVIMVEIGIGGTLLLSYLNNSVYGVKLSNAAFSAAHSGINDAVMKILLNKSCGTDIACSAVPYTIAMEYANVEVSICKNDCPAVPSMGTDDIYVTAVGTSLTKTKRLIAIVNASSTTGFVTINSITEIPE